VRQLFELLGPGHQLVEVGSTCGHDGFLTDVEVFGEVVARFLEERRSS
jgi:homoserine acetyltransferase